MNRRAGRASAARPVRIGLTGPIGCGKSTIAGWLGELGARVVDADRIARDATPPGSPELAAVVGEFGPGVLQPDGTLDRRTLGRIVFADRAALARLEAIIHPAVRPRILAVLATADRDGVPAVVIEAIKLVEGGLADLCDEVWLVTCDPGAAGPARPAGCGSDRHGGANRRSGRPRGAPHPVRDPGHRHDGCAGAGTRARSGGVGRRGGLSPGY